MVEVSRATTKRFLEEQKAVIEVLKRNGHKEGVAWAEKAPFNDLQAMVRNFKAWYGESADTNVFNIHNMLNDEKHGIYWTSVFNRNPDMQEMSNQEVPGCSMAMEANAFFLGWLDGVDEFYTEALHQMKILHSEERMEPDDFAEWKRDFVSGRGKGEAGWREYLRDVRNSRMSLI